MEKKDTENMEMKKPEEQAKPKKKKIISVVRPQNATSKEAKEFTKNQGQKKDRPSRGNGRPEGNRNGNGRSEDRPNRGNGNGGNGDRPNRNGDRPQGERRFGGNNGDRPNRSGDRPGGDRNNGGRSGNGERSGRPFGERSARPNGGRPGNNGGRPFAGKDDDSQNQNRRPGGDRRRTEHKSSAGDTMSLGIKKPGRDTGRKEKDKNKDSLRENNFETEVGPGVYDIHSPRVPSVDEIVNALNIMLTKISRDKLWVNPDCGLKTRGVKETDASLRNMVEAAKIIRNR